MVDVHTSQSLLPLPLSSQYSLGSAPSLAWTAKRGQGPPSWSQQHKNDLDYDSDCSTIEDQRYHFGNTEEACGLFNREQVGYALDAAGMSTNKRQTTHVSSNRGSQSETASNMCTRSRSSTNPAIPDIAHIRQSQPVSRASSRPASPIFQQTSQVTSTGNVIVPYLQLPSTISHTQGSLAEFAAQITCLFWFESSNTVAAIENSELSPSLSAKLVNEAYPATGFMKWVTTILSTTQVTQNVILLALLFVYRLKKQCPNVKGKLGSEYRLLTVALMLGNKFLDDNTYTNKTWAEVSGISVHEIHVMEVEFLSHMKYNLYTSKEQWDKWHQELGKFWRYFDRASRRMREMTVKQVDIRRPSLQIPYALPSPPASTNTSPPFAQPISPSVATFSTPATLPPHLAPYALSPVASIPEYSSHVNPRKRSHDASMQDPLAKRQSVHGLHPSASMGLYGHGVNMPMQSIPTLPIPNSTQSYGHPRATASLNASVSNGRSTPPAPLPSVSWLAGLTPSGSVQPHQPHLYIPNGGQADRSGQHTPTSKSAVHPTPSSTPFASSAAHSMAPNQLSPSHFLTSRSSPYRPVRNMSTLLVPPPSGSLQHPAADVSQEQMRWQPLGKNVNERSGRVPYLHRDAWPDTHQFNQWPSMYSVN